MLGKCWGIWHLLVNEGDGRDSGKMEDRVAQNQQWLKLAMATGYIVLDYLDV